jgi:hypothetical protein
MSPQEWNAAREELLVKEKALTRARDALAAERRPMPRMSVVKNYGSENAGAPHVVFTRAGHGLAVYWTNRHAPAHGHAARFFDGRPRDLWTRAHPGSPEPQCAGRLWV